MKKDGFQLRAFPLKLSYQTVKHVLFGEIQGVNARSLGCQRGGTLVRKYHQGPTKILSHVQERKVSIWGVLGERRRKLGGGVGLSF